MGACRHGAVLLIAVVALCAEAAERVMRTGVLEASDAKSASISVDSKGFEQRIGSASKDAQQPYMVMPSPGTAANFQYVPMQPRAPVMSQPMQMVPAGMAMQQPQMPQQPQQQQWMYLPPQAAMQQPGQPYGQPMMQTMPQRQQQPLQQQMAPQMMQPPAAAGAPQAVPPQMMQPAAVQSAQVPAQPMAPVAATPVAAQQPVAQAQQPVAQPLVAAVNPPQQQQPAAAVAAAATAAPVATAAPAAPAATPGVQPVAADPVQSAPDTVVTPAKRRTVVMVVIGSLNVVLFVWAMRRFYFSPYPKNFSGLAAMLQQRRTDNPVPTSALFEESKFKPPSRYGLAKQSAKNVPRRAPNFEDSSSQSPSSEEIEPHQYRNRERVGAGPVAN